MATLVDMNLDAVDFEAANAELLRLKIDDGRTLPASQTRVRITAAWGNFVDDFLRALRTRTLDLDQRVTEIEDTPAGGGVYASSTTLVTVGNTTTPTDVIGATIDGGDATAGNVIRLRLGGRYVNTSGSVRTFTIALSLGGTALWQDESNSQGSSAPYTAWNACADIYVVDATTVRAIGDFRQHTTNAPDVGLGATTVTHRSDAPIATDGPVTVPTLASDRVLSLTITHSAADEDIILERYGYTVEIL